MPIILGGMLALVLGLLPQIFLRRVEEGRSRQGPHEAGHGRSADAYGRHADHGRHPDYGRRDARRTESVYYR
jgi:hypothetical protein